METTRTDLPTVRIAAVRATVPMSGLTAFYDTAYTRVAQAAEREGWTIAGPAVGWYTGMPSDTADVAAGFAVEGAGTGAESDGVEVVELPGGDALVVTYTGAYDGLPDAWAGVEQERAALGVDGRGDFWRSTSPTPRPAATRTRTSPASSCRCGPTPEPDA